MKKYRLLPNDTLIASTCKYYGIKKIATFDNDFKRVDLLEIVDPYSCERLFNVNNKLLLHGN